MNYTEGVIYMKKITEESDNQNLFIPCKGIIINYPGTKKFGDYRLTLQNGQAPTHGYICKILYNLLTNLKYTFTELCNFLHDVYKNGTNTNYNDSNLEYLKNLIFWITLQEEINYPKSLGYSGVNLSFCRFFESIYCTQGYCIFNINDVFARCYNHGHARPVLYPIPSAPEFYHY